MNRVVHLGHIRGVLLEVLHPLHELLGQRPELRLLLLESAVPLLDRWEFAEVEVDSLQAHRGRDKAEISDGHMISSRVLRVVLLQVRLEGGQSDFHALLSHFVARVVEENGRHLEKQGERLNCCSGDKTGESLSTHRVGGNSVVVEASVEKHSMVHNRPLLRVLRVERRVSGMVLVEEVLDYGHTLRQEETVVVQDGNLLGRVHLRVLLGHVLHFAIVHIDQLVGDLQSLQGEPNGQRWGSIDDTVQFHL